MLGRLRTMIEEMHWEDAAELILAGATAVGMGTALFVDPGLVGKVVAGLEPGSRVVVSLDRPEIEAGVRAREADSEE